MPSVIRLFSAQLFYFPVQDRAPVQEVSWQGNPTFYCLLRCGHLPRVPTEVKRYSLLSLLRILQIRSLLVRTPRSP